MTRLGRGDKIGGKVAKMQRANVSDDVEGKTEEEMAGNRLQILIYATNSKEGS